MCVSCMPCPQHPNHLPRDLTPPSGCGGRGCIRIGRERVEEWRARGSCSRVRSRSCTIAASMGRSRHTRLFSCSRLRECACNSKRVRTTVDRRRHEVGRVRLHCRCHDEHRHQAVREDILCSGMQPQDPFTACQRLAWRAECLHIFDSLTSPHLTSGLTCPRPAHPRGPSRGNTGPAPCPARAR